MLPGGTAEAEELLACRPGPVAVKLELGDIWQLIVAHHVADAVNDLAGQLRLAALHGVQTIEGDVDHRHEFLVAQGVADQLIISVGDAHGGIRHRRAVLVLLHHVKHAEVDTLHVVASQKLKVGTVRVEHGFPVIHGITLFVDRLGIDLAFTRGGNDQQHCKRWKQ